MCLSIAYEVTETGRKKLAEFVSSVEEEGGKITLRDVMGLETVVEGRIRKLDLVNNEILLVKA